MKKFYRILVILCFCGVVGTANAQDLVHYWNFNDAATQLTPTVSLVPNGAITYAPGPANGTELSEVVSGTGQNFATGNANARNADAAGAHLRFNIPVGGSLDLALPTTGYENAIVKFVTRRSGSGPGLQYWAYSINGTDYIALDTIDVTEIPTLVTFDFGSISAADNNPNFKLQATFALGTSGDGGGNNRFDNFSLDATEAPIVESLVHYWNFNDAATQLTPNVSKASSGVITYTPGPANGTELSEVVSGTGQNYATANLNARHGDAAGAHLRFNIPVGGSLDLALPTTGYENPVVKFTTRRSGSGPGLQYWAYSVNGTDYIALDTVDVTETPTLITFNFDTAALADNNPNFKLRATFALGTSGDGGGNNRFDNLSLDATKIPVLVHYWNFNTPATQLTPSTGTTGAITFTAGPANGTELSEVVSGTGQNFATANVNARHGDAAGAHLRFNIPVGGSLDLALPTTGHKNAVVKFVTRRSGSGPGLQYWAYSVNGTDYIALDTIDVTETPTLVTFDFDSISAADHNPNFKLQATFALGTSGDGGGNNRFDNLSLDALKIDGYVDEDEEPEPVGPTEIALASTFVVKEENAGTFDFALNITNPSVSSVDFVVLGAPYSTADNNDFTVATGTINLDGTSATYNISITIVDDAVEEQAAEYFVVKLQNPVGASITGDDFATLYIRDNDRQAPVPSKEIELTHVGSFVPGASTAEIVVHDKASQRLFIISSVQDRLDVADFSNPADITLIESIDMLPYGGITSVAVKNGIVAVASPNVNVQENGSVVFFDTNGTFLKQVTVGSLPDMVVFTPDGTKVMTANEGEPNDAYTVDPEGSFSIIDISGGVANLTQENVSTLDFTGFNSQEAALVAAGVRKIKVGSTLSQDIEPEYITVSPDSKKAWVTLQEVNAVGEIDLETKTITSVWPLGKKDLSVVGNGIDASDVSGVVTIANWPVKSFYLPDAISGYTAGGTRYLVTANEGDEKELSGLNERTTVGAVALDPAVFPHAAMLKKNHNLGRLRMTTLSGDANGDGLYEEINVPGARSFTIWNADTKTKVFDSGDDFERYTSTEPSIAALFNSDHEDNSFKSRSRAKGPEPEGLAIASFNGKTFAFVSLERVGGVMVYNITDPANPVFVEYKNSRSTEAYAGDHGPEGILYISPDDSPDHKGYIAIANEISGSISIFEITPTPMRNQTITFNELPSRTVGDAPFNFTATASSDLAVVYTTEDDQITIAGNQATVVKAGVVTVHANQPGNEAFNPASEVSQSFCVNPAKPLITLVAGAGDPVLHSSAASGNQWYKDGVLIAGSTGTDLSVSTVGSYTVKATVETCVSALSDAYTVLITGLEGSGHNVLQIYPNPASDKVRIVLPDNGNKEVSIYQSNGVLKNVKVTSANELEVDLATYTPGYYIVRVTTQQTVFYNKFIKK